MGVRQRLRLGSGMAAIVLAVWLPSPAFAQTTKPSGDVAFGRSIALIRGHLLEGEELVKLHEWSAAYPHFAFPTEEIYGVIREELPSYQTPQFDHALKALAHTVRSHSIRQYSKALAKVDAALAAADAGLKVRQLDWPKFTMAVAVEVLKTAAEEYDNAIEDGRITHATGYRTARGFVLQADRMIEHAVAEMPGSDPAAFADIRIDMSKIRSAFAGQSAPERLTIDQKAFEQAVSNVQLALQKLAASGKI